MLARVTRTQIRPDKAEEAITLFRTDVVQSATEQAGLKGIVLLADRATGNGFTMTLWESEADMRVAQESGWTRQQLGRFAPMLTGEPTIETYEVAVRVRPTAAITNARIVGVQITPDKLDEAIALYRDSVIPAAREQPGFLGGILLIDRATGKGISNTAWASEGEMRASESSGYLQTQLQKFGSLLAAPPQIETYEVGAAWIAA
jgi:quinol monooxygenase YgiN